MITTRFPSSYCLACQRDVLLYHRLDEDGALVLSCLHCNASPQPSPSPSPSGDVVRWLNSQAVGKLGYFVEGDDSPPPEATKTSGCGKPNCGQGTCRNSGKKHPFSH